MKHTTIYIDNNSKTIGFNEQISNDIGASLLSFIKLKWNSDNSEHPYIKHFPNDKETLVDAQSCYGNAIIECLYVAPYYQPDYESKLDVPSQKPNEFHRGGLLPMQNMRSLLAVERVCERGFNDILIDLKMRFEAIKISNGETRLYEVYTVYNVLEVCCIEFMKMVQFNLCVRICDNCKHFFIPKGEYNVRYCDRIPQGETRTCQQIGAVKTFKSKVADNPILTEYNKIYRRFHSRKRYGIIKPEQFKAWTKKAVQIRDTAIKDGLTVEQFQAEIDGISI